MGQPIIENLEDRKGHTMRDWICLDSTNREIYRRFFNFLSLTVDDTVLAHSVHLLLPRQGQNVHEEKIRKMVIANGESLVIRCDAQSPLFMSQLPGAVHEGADPCCVCGRLSD